MTDEESLIDRQIAAAYERGRDVSADESLSSGDRAAISPYGGLSCRNPACDRNRQRARDMFCTPCYRRLPAELARGLWNPMYGGTAHVQKCIEALNK